MKVRQELCKGLKQNSKNDKKTSQPTISLQMLVKLTALSTCRPQTEGSHTRTLSETRGRRMLSKCFPCLLKTKWLSLDFGIIKCSWTSSPSIEDENVNACRVESDTCIKNIKKKIRKKAEGFESR